MDNQPSADNPWLDAEERYLPGQEVRGTVTRMTQFGVLVQIEPGLEGIIYTFELGSGPAAVAGFAPGQEMQLYVQSVDASRKRLELSLNNQPAPGLLEERTIPAALRRSKAPGERPRAAPLALPDELSQPAPFTLPDAPSEPNEQACPTCQRPVLTSWKHCVYCGGSLRRHCPACGSAQPDLPDARYCCECGKQLA